MTVNADATSPPDVLGAMVTAFDTGDVRGLGDVVHPEYVDHQGLGELRPINGVEGFRHVAETAKET